MFMLGRAWARQQLSSCNAQSVSKGIIPASPLQRASLSLHSCRAGEALCLYLDSQQTE